MARPYLLYGLNELRRMTNILEPAIADWEGRWFGTQSITLQCTHASAAPVTTDWWYSKPESGLGLFVHKQPGLNKAITLAAFGDLPRTAGLGNTPSPIVGDCITELIADLSAIVLGALGVASGTKSMRLIAQAPDKEYFAAGSGALQLQLNGPTLCIDLVLPGAHALSALRTEPAEKSQVASVPLENAMPMIHSHALRLTALLGQAELDIGTLQSIAVGDVIRFDTRIDQPTTLVTTEGARVASGYLGRRNQFKSLQLTK